MELKGKKINFFGDSITEGCMTSGEGYRFSDLLCREYDLSAARNYGIGGTRYARQSRPSENPRWDLDFCSRVAALDEDADIVLVFGGTNDYGHGDAPFGSFDDRSADSFCGACHVLYRSLLEKFPGKVVAVVTPLHRLGDEQPHSSWREEELRLPLAGYVEMIRRVARFYSLPVLDLFDRGVLDPHDAKVHAELVPDGLHPNDAGHIVLAREIGAFLSAY